MQTDLSAAHRAALKLSTKCRQLEWQKWKLPKKFPFLRGLNVKGDSPSPFTIPLTDPGLDKKGFVYSLSAAHRAALKLFYD